MSEFDDILAELSRAPDGMARALCADLGAIAAGRECWLSETTAVVRQAGRIVDEVPRIPPRRPL